MTGGHNQHPRFTATEQEGFHETASLSGRSSPLTHSRDKYSSTRFYPFTRLFCLQILSYVVSAYSLGIEDCILYPLRRDIVFHRLLCEKGTSGIMGASFQADNTAVYAAFESLVGHLSC